MHQYLLSDMIESLISKKIIDRKNGYEAIKICTAFWSDKIAIVWSLQDILNAAKEDKIRCSKAKAAKILQLLYVDHDCNYGISWDTIRSYLS